MPKVSLTTNVRIHEYCNVAMVILLEVAAGIALWFILNNVFFWVICYFFLFFVVGFLSHRLVPRITGPIIDRLFIVDI